MQRIVRCFAVLGFACGALWLGGCPAKPAADSSGENREAGDGDHEGHDHEGHDHGDHAHGPHDGEIIELAGAEPGDEGHAEWTHDDDTGLVTVYILDSEAKEELPIDASEVSIEVRVQNKEPVTYTLTAVAPDADGKSSRFELEEHELLTSLKLKDAVDAQLTVPIDGRELTGKVEMVEHDHHHH
jgi:hypothetical protein